MSLIGHLILLDTKHRRNMRMKKRILAGLLTVCLLISMLPAMAFAAEESKIDNYADFLKYLAALEELAQMYADQNPGKDPIALVIKYIRTGVDRYNSGSWGIMAGYEDAEFASFVRRMEVQINMELPEGQEPFQVTSMKNIEEFKIGDSLLNKFEREPIDHNPCLE